MIFGSLKTIFQSPEDKPVEITTTIKVSNFRCNLVIVQWISLKFGVLSNILVLETSSWS